MSRVFLLLIIISFLQSCVFLRDTKSPIAWKHYKLSEKQTTHLLVLLPGVNNDLLSYEKNGFFNDIKQYNPGFDVITVNAHIGYYFSGDLIEQLHYNVIIPAKKMGYQQIVMAGISLGGYGSLWYNHEYGNEIKGLLLIAPYLGENDLIQAIEQQGGVRQWRSKTTLEDRDFAAKAWLWIDDDIIIKKSSVLLTYGVNDKFSIAAQLLASHLPESQVYAGDGVHNWATWRILWDDLLFKEKIDNMFN